MSRVADLYSIVVLGAMNPAIHVPEWYQELRLISDTERETALGDPSLLRTRAASQFNSGVLSINCTESRWEVRTNDEGNWERVVGVAAGTFERLDETPVSSFGVNFNVHRETRLPSVPKFMGRGVAHLSGLPSSEWNRLGLGTISFSEGNDTRLLTVRIEPSQCGPAWVFMAFNFHHNIVAKGRFNLGELVRAAFPVDYDEYQARAPAILSRLIENGNKPD